MQSFKTVVERRNIKNSYIRILDDGIVRLRVPLWYTESHVQKLLQKKGKWIEEHLVLIKERRERVCIKPSIFVLLGKEYKIIVKPEMGTSVHINLEEKIIYSGFPMPTAASRKWLYKIQAERYIKNKTFHAARKLGFNINKVTIRGQKRFWGTYSHKGRNISLNWKLMLAPEFVIDYLIAHELMHVRHPNHGPDFKNDLLKVFPRTPEALQWLKDHNEILNIY